MESQDHKITTPSGHENHGPYLCHKCGWPFPNPHPSARHRRAHKKVCGKIEGYKLSESETTAVSDDEHHSDGDHRTPSPNGKMTSVKSYRSEDETFSDAVTEFSDSGISPGMEERSESIKNLSINVKEIDDELLKADATGGIAVNDPESSESSTDETVADKSLGRKLDSPIDNSPIKSEIPGDASINATESIEAKQVQNDSKGIEGINDAIEASVEVSPSVVSDTDEKTSNNESYESKTQEAEEKTLDPLSHSPESKLLEAEEQATDSVPIGADPHSAYLKLDLPEADVKALDVVNVDKEHEQLGCCVKGGGISTQLSPILVSNAVSSNEIDGSSQMEFSDSSKTEEVREDDVHVVSLPKDRPALDNPELLKDFKDYNKFKSSFQFDLDDAVATSEVTQDTDGSIMSVALDVLGDQVTEERLVVSAEEKTDSCGLASIPITSECGLSSIPNSSDLIEHEDFSDMNTIVSSVQEEGKQETKVDDLEIERTETSFTMAEENKGGQTENELFGNKETTLEDTICSSEANQTMVTVEGIHRDKHEQAVTEHPIVVGVETEKEIAEGDKTICHNDRAIVTDTTTVHESREEIFHDAKAFESASATVLDSKIISDSDVKGPTDLNSRVVENVHAGDDLKSATGVISSAKQNDTVSAVYTPMTSSSRADSLDANWGSVSVLSTQSESTAVHDAEPTDARGLEKLQKPTSGADKSDIFEPPSFMTLVESTDKKTAASEIETQAKTEALKAGWFPSITNAVNESQGRKKNEEIIAKVTNWSGTTKQHTPLKSLLGEAKSPNTKQVPKKDENAAASTKTTTTVNSILSSVAPLNKEAEKEWNSPARYPVDIKKEKRKTKPYWVPFVCCSSVHQDA